MLGHVCVLCSVVFKGHKVGPPLTLVKQLTVKGCLNCSTIHLPYSGSVVRWSSARGLWWWRVLSCSLNWRATPNPPLPKPTPTPYPLRLCRRATLSLFSSWLCPPYKSWSYRTKQSDIVVLKLAEDEDAFLCSGYKRKVCLQYCRI